MKIKALITALVLGSSSVAMARPFEVNAFAQASWSVGTSGSVVVRDHRSVPPPAPPAPTRPSDRYPGSYEPALYPNNNKLGGDASTYAGARPAPVAHDGYGYSRSWLAITEPTRIDRGRQFIAVGTELGRFTRLRLQNAAGTSMITHIKIEFDDNQMQTVELNKQLDRRNPVIDIDLTGNSGRFVKRVIVYGSTAQGSAYQLLAK